MYLNWDADTHRLPLRSFDCVGPWLNLVVTRLVLTYSASHYDFQTMPGRMEIGHLSRRDQSMQKVELRFL